MSYIDDNFIPADESRSPRERRLLRAQMTDSLGATCDIVIRNVSEKGLGASVQGVPPTKGSAVKITISQDMAMSGTVRWFQGSAIGIELDNPINLQMLTDVIQRKHHLASRDAQWEVRRLHQVNSDHLDQTKFRRV